MGIAGELLGKLANAMGGTALGSITDFINARWPPDMSEEQKAQVNLALRDYESKEKQAAFEREKEAMKISFEIEKEFNQRTRDLEGTAADLKSIPFLGSIIIFLRGMQRPLWGFGTLWCDFKVFSGGWGLRLWKEGATGGNFITPEGFILIIINFLVLAFLFGERAIVNITPVLMPLIEKIWGGQGNK
jgi:hypothetical protein